MKKRILSVIATLVLSVTALQAQVSFGVVAGPNFQNVTGKDHYGDKLDNGLLVGFHAGAKVIIPFAKDFGFQSGIIVSQKGSRNNDIFFTTKSSGSDYTTTTRITFLELPLNLIFRPEFLDGHILLGFGPYFAVGIGGKQKADASPLVYEQKIKFKNKITFDEYWDIDHAYYRPFDAGANIFAGYELDMGLYFQLNAQMGLLKINPEIEESDDEAVYKNTGFGLSVGYNF